MGYPWHSSILRGEGRSLQGVKFTSCAGLGNDRGRLEEAPTAHLPAVLVRPGEGPRENQM